MILVLLTCFTKFLANATGGPFFIPLSACSITNMFGYRLYAPARSNQTLSFTTAEMAANPAQNQKLLGLSSSSCMDTNSCIHPISSTHHCKIEFLEFHVVHSNLNIARNNQISPWN